MMISASSSIRNAVLRSAVFQRAGRNLTRLPQESSILLRHNNYVSSSSDDQRIPSSLPLHHVPILSSASYHSSSSSSSQQRHAGNTITTTTSRMASSMPLSDYPYDTDDDDDDDNDEHDKEPWNSNITVAAPLAEPNLPAIEQTYQNLANLLDVDTSRVHPHFCNYVIKKLCKRRNEASFRRAERIVTEMERLGRDVHGTTMTTYTTGRPVAVPDAYTYLNLMKGYLFTGERKYTDRARATLARMDAACKSGYCSDTLTVPADDVFRQTFIFATPQGVRERRDNADACLRMLLEMERPKTKALNMVLYKLAVRHPHHHPTDKDHHHHHSSGQAETLLRNACEWYLTKEHHAECRPDLISFNTTIKAHAERGEGARARSVFRFMEELRSTGHSDFSPDVFTYTSAIAAWCHDKTVSPLRAAEEATVLLENLRDRIIDGDLSTDALRLNVYTDVLRLWGNCKSDAGAIRAEAVVHDMEDMADKGFTKLQPNTIVYNALLSVLGARRMPDKCEEILSTMQRKYEAGDHAVKPDVVSHACYCKACAVDSSYAAHQKTWSVVRGMERNFDDGVSDVEPDTLTYQTLLSSGGYALREGGEMAEQILRHMEERYEQKGRVKARPCAHTYRSVLQAWLRGAHRNKVERMYALLCRCERNTMDDDGDDNDENTRPLLVLYNMVLEACANVSLGTAEQNTDVILQGMEVFRKIRDAPRLTPSSQTYLSLLEACAEKIERGPKRNKALGTIFQQCTADGVVDVHVLRSLQRHAPLGLQANLLRGGEHYDPNYVTIRDLPREWTVNGGRDGRVEMRPKTRRMIRKSKTKHAGHRRQHP